jgi:hemerythrin-like metal-binding protein
MKRSHRTYPEWLYNTLPFLYLATGLAIDFFVPGWIGKVVGLTLLVLAGFIWYRRFSYRQIFEQAQESTFSNTLINTGDLPKDGLIQMSWNKTLECGHPLIDGQHHRLFALANEAINLLLTRAPRKEEETLLKQLLDDMSKHFVTEEDLLEEAGDPGLLQHKVEHQEMLRKAQSLHERFHHGEVISRELVSFLSNDVISNHIVRENLSLITTGR